MHLQGGAVASVLLPTCQANVRYRSSHLNLSQPISFKKNVEKNKDVKDSGDE